MQSRIGRARIFRIDGDESDKGFDLAALDTIVANFSARKVGTQTDVPAPVHLGHEDDRAIERAVLRTDLPSLGEPRKLWRDGTELWAEIEAPEAVLPLYTLYPNRSAEIYRDFQGRGPTLKGIGLLGASQPAKKGLGPVVLNDATGGEYVCANPVDGAIQFTEEPMPNPKPAPTPEPKAPPTGPTAEQFSEVMERVKALETQNTEKNGLLAEQKTTIAALRAQVEKAQSEAFSEQITGLVERDFVNVGRISPALAPKLTALLKKSQGIEKFAEGEDVMSATVALLKELVPARAKAPGRPVVDRPGSPDVSAAVEQFVVYRSRQGGTAPWERFAEGLALESDAIAKGAALVPAELKTKA